MVSLCTYDRKKFDVEMTAEDYNKIRYCDFKSLNNLIMINFPNFEYGLTFNEYLFVWFETFKNDKNLADVDKQFIDKLSELYYPYVEYVSIINDLVLHEKGEALDFKFNEELFNAIRKNMNPDYTPAQRIIYSYFKLCFLLKGDTKYNFCYFISPERTRELFKKSANRLEEISPLNNEVSSFEFEALMNKIIRMEGSFAQTKEFNGNSQHVFVDSVINRIFFRFDPYVIPIGVASDNNCCDFETVKMDLGYNGVVANYKDIEEGRITKYSFIDDIYLSVENEYRGRFRENKFSDEASGSCFDTIDKLDISEQLNLQLKTYFVQFDDCFLEGVDFYGYILKNFAPSIAAIENLDLVGVCTNIDDCDLSLILSIKQNNGDYAYFMFGRNRDIDFFDKTQLEHLVLDGSVIVQKKDSVNKFGSSVDSDSSYNFIPGIDIDIQKMSNELATQNLLPKIMRDIYLESLGDANSFGKK